MAKLLSARPSSLRLFPISGLSLLLLAACGGGDDAPPAPAGPAAGTRATLALLETSDLHFNVRSYDYFKLAEDKSFGYERTLTLIKAARKEFTNSLLLDNGDTIQGTAFSDYEAQVKPVSCDQTLSMYKVMNDAKFDVGNIGNHEFNYGLPFLNQVTGSSFNVDGVDATRKCAGPAFPLVVSNVYSAKTKAPLFAPYTILTRQLSATTPDGKTVTVPVKVGVVGVTTPGIMNWDKRWLDGRVYTVGAREAATQFVAEARKAGADLVVVLNHGGLSGETYSPTMENAAYHVAQVAGIDAIMMGHSHLDFPDAKSTNPNWNLPGVDKTAGTIHGVPALMPSFWGKALGVIRMNLVWDGKAWSVDKTRTVVELRKTQNADKTFVEADASVAPMVEAQHQATIAYVKTPIGTSDFAMTSYFADLGDPAAIQIVNQAQADYIRKYIQANLPEYRNLPVLSVSAPFKSGYGGGKDFTDVAMGNVAINNAADLYLYPNTIQAVKVSGADLKTWLEMVAKRFNQIDPAKTTDQQLISSFPGYNFDMFTTPDMKYEIDVTQPVGSRIRNLQYKGAPIDPAAQFIIATNNYRASSGAGLGIPGLDGSKTIYASPDANRDVLIEYIKSVKTLTRTANGSARSWTFTKAPTAGRVLFTSGQNQLANAVAAGLTNVSLVAADDGSGKNQATYQIDLGK